MGGIIHVCGWVEFEWGYLSTKESKEGVLFTYRQHKFMQICMYLTPSTHIHIWEEWKQENF